MTSLANKNTCIACREPEYTFYFTAKLYLTVLSSHMISLTNENTALLWRRNCFMFSNSYMGVLVISVRIRIVKCPNMENLNHNRNYSDYRSDSVMPICHTGYVIRICSLIDFCHGWLRKLTIYDPCYLQTICKAWNRTTNVHSAAAISATHFKLWGLIIL